jgi:hypothetical protein
MRLWDSSETDTRGCFLSDWCHANCCPQGANLPALSRAVVACGWCSRVRGCCCLPTACECCCSKTVVSTRSCLAVILKPATTSSAINTLPHCQVWHQHHNRRQQHIPDDPGRDRGGAGGKDHTLVGALGTGGGLLCFLLAYTGRLGVWLDWLVLVGAWEVRWGKGSGLRQSPRAPTHRPNRSNHRSTNQPTNPSIPPQPHPPNQPQVAVITRGMESIKTIEKCSAPVLVALALALLAWAVSSAGGFGPMLSAPSRLTTPGAFWGVFLPSLTAQVGYCEFRLVGRVS